MGNVGTRSGNVGTRSGQRGDSLWATWGLVVGNMGTRSGHSYCSGQTLELMTLA